MLMKFIFSLSKTVVPSKVHLNRRFLHHRIRMLECSHGYNARIPVCKQGGGSASGTNVSKLSSLRAHYSSLDQNNIKRRVSGHLIATSINIGKLYQKLQSLDASASLRDSLIIVENCHKLGHHDGTVVITQSGVIVLWDDCNNLNSYKSLIEDVADVVHMRDDAYYSNFSETLDINLVPGRSKVLNDSILLTTSSQQSSDKVAISLALMTAIKLNDLECDIKRKLMMKNDNVVKLKNNLNGFNLDKLAQTLFDYQIYVHDCRYRLNIEQDFLELPDLIWESDEQCNLYLNVQSIFCINKRLDRINHRISWALEILNSYSEYVRHKHSSRLEKIIIAVISIELALGMGNTYFKIST